MHLTTDGLLRPWTQCFHLVETWCSQICQTVFLNCSLKVKWQGSTAQSLSFSCVMWKWHQLANGTACFSVMLPGFDSAEEDRKLRLFAVDSYISLLQQEADRLPQRFLQVISWVSLLLSLRQSGWRQKKVFHLSSHDQTLSVYFGLNNVHINSINLKFTKNCFKIWVWPRQTGNGCWGGYCCIKL